MHFATHPTDVFGMILTLNIYYFSEDHQAVGLSNGE
jgi:hypothetical protein